MSTPIKDNDAIFFDGTTTRKRGGVSKSTKRRQTPIIRIRKKVKAPHYFVEIRPLPVVKFSQALQRPRPQQGRLRLRYNPSETFNRAIV